MREGEGRFWNVLEGGWRRALRFLDWERLRKLVVLEEKN